MNGYRISSLYIYPVKSLGGITVDACKCLGTGL